MEASPAALYLGTGLPGQTLAGQVVVHSGRGEELEIEDFAWVSTTLEAQPRMERLGEGRYLIRIATTLPTRTGVHDSKLTVRCHKPAVRSVVIPVSAYVLAEESE